MNITNVLIALVVFVLGLIPLRLMYLWERAPLQLSLVYFVVQHFVFGFGGLLLAVVDRGYLYSNAHGYFAWADGLPRLLLLHLVSLYAGLIGVRVGTFGSRRRTRSSSSGHPKILLAHNSDVSGSFKSRSDACTRSTTGDFLTASNQGSNLQHIVQNASPLLRRICFLALLAHSALTVLSWLNSYGRLDTLSGYIVATFYPIAGVVFFFWGLWWRHAGRERIVAIVWLALFGLIQMASGGRGVFLYGVLLFAYGVFLISPSDAWRLRPRQIAIGAVGLVLVGWLMVVSDDIRGIYRNRTPANADEWADRVTGLLQPKLDTSSGLSGGSGQEAGLLEGVTFRVVGRLVELSALDVVARTPEQIPYWGWQDDDWSMLATNWLPTFFFPDQFTHEDAGVLFLRQYGWLIILGEEGTAMPATLLADAWRRSGWSGMFVLYLWLGVFLSRLSMWTATRITHRRFNLFWFIASACLLVTFAFSYTTDWISFVTFLPRRFLAISVYGVSLSAVCKLMGGRGAVRNKVSLHRVAA